MKKTAGIFLLCLLLTGMVHASDGRLGRGLFGDIDGYLIMSNEDDTLDSDVTVLKSELSLWKDYSLGTVQLEPYYYFRNDTTADSIHGSVLTENMVGTDLVLQQSDLMRVSTGIAYKYRYKVSGNNDALVITRFRLDF
jgi:hypothetical protein